MLKAVRNFVIVDNSCGAGNFSSHVHYNWRDYPCDFKECAVYNCDLPSPLFILPVKYASILKLLKHINLHSNS